MHFTEICLINFGQYNGEQVLDLRSLEEDNGITNRPIILIGGKNGAGKTTILEAVKLCLYGSQFLGVDVRRQSYEAYLTSRIHRQFGAPLQNTFAGVSVSFIYTADGVSDTFQVRRMWQRKRQSIAETLTVIRNGTELVPTEYAWWEQFLHDLLPPGLADLFFFDGEKIQALADDPDYTELGQSIRSLLGLDLLERLRIDLNIYLTRQKRSSEPALEQQLAAVEIERATIEEEFSAAYMHLASLNREIEQKQGKIEEQERRLASEGGDIAARRNELKLHAETLRVEIHRLERAIEEQASTLFPFAVIPHLCLELRERLLIETHSVHQIETRAVVDTFAQEVLERLIRDDQQFIGKSLTGEDRAKIIAGFTELVQATVIAMSGDMQDSGSLEIRHDIAHQDRQEMLYWLDQAITTVPEMIHELGTAIEKAIGELAQVEVTLLKMPAEETIQPILQHLSQLNQEIGVLKNHQANQEHLVRQIDLKREELNRREQQIYLRIMRGDDPTYRGQLASRAQQALVKYAALLRQEKMRDLERHIVECFAHLSRKGNYIKRVTIDPVTFETTLFNQKDDFLPREQLSAGEKQIYAVAVLWALRLVSGRSLPIIVDTPLGRLDNDHRERLVQHYFPQASHQVVLLSTDTEIDADLYADLAPTIARAYHLIYQPRDATTQITSGYFWELDEEDSQEAFA